MKSQKHAMGVITTFILVLLSTAEWIHWTKAFTISSDKACKLSIICRRSVRGDESIFENMASLRKPPVTPTFVTQHKTSTTTILSAGRGEKDDITYDGRGRGQILFALVFLICVWQFTIPPSFRRAKFCPTPCVADRTLCRNPCVTLDEWTNDVAEYYRNGGGIQWDFSIDPNTLAENQRIIQNVFGAKMTLH